MGCKSTRIIRGHEVPCGNCSGCRATEEWRKASRIAAECVMSGRTWWVTFTFALERSEAEAYAEVQKLIKRLRKAGFTLRYAVVPEWGEATQRLHYHAMIHCGNALTKRALEAQWPHGFTRCRLIGGRLRKATAWSRGRAASRLARYLAKYMTKGHGRFRFSQGYGSRAVKALIGTNDAVAAVLEHFPGAEVARVRVAGMSMPRKLYGGSPAPAPAEFLPAEVQRDCDDIWNQVALERAAKPRASRLVEADLFDGYRDWWAISPEHWPEVGCSDPDGSEASDDEHLAVGH